MPTYYTTAASAYEKCPPCGSSIALPTPSPNIPQFCNFGLSDCDYGLFCLLGPSFLFTSIIVLFLSLYRVGTACDSVIVWDGFSSAISGLITVVLVAAIIAAWGVYRNLLPLLLDIPDFNAGTGPASGDCTLIPGARISLQIFRSLNIGYSTAAAYLIAGFSTLIFTCAYVAFYYCSVPS